MSGSQAIRNVIGIYLELLDLEYPEHVYEGYPPAVAYSPGNSPQGGYGASDNIIIQQTRWVIGLRLGDVEFNIR